MSNNLKELVSKDGIIATTITLIPTFAWLYFLFSDSKKRKIVMALIFFGGILTVAPLLLMQELFSTFPDTNFIRLIPDKIPNVAISAIVIIVILAMLEEIFKQLFLRFIDEKYLLVTSVNDSVKFAMVAALGFSFMENVYPYFYRIIHSGRYGQLMSIFLMRSLFTSAMHIAVSGIFGYYYGVAKFSVDFREESNWEGKKLYFARFLNRFFDVPLSKAYKEQRIFYGLCIAMGIHGLFNTLANFELVLPGLILVAISFVYLMLLLKSKEGETVMVNDIDTNRSTIAKKDEDVIIELIGVWFNEKKYKDVIQICDKLLMRDPSNNIVKLFRSKSVDQLEGNTPATKAIQMMESAPTPAEDHSRISLWIEMQKSRGSNVANNFQNSPEFKKFQEEERAKKEKDGSFKLDLG